MANEEKGCTHVQPAELARMGEEFLRARNVPDSQWEGARFRYIQNLEKDVWKSVCMEVVRRGGNWVVVRLDRRDESAIESETGFRVLQEPVSGS